MKIISITKITDAAYRMVINAPDITAAAKPGQFVHIKCGEGNMLRRPISICSVDGDELTIIFEVRGKGTDWLAGRSAGEDLDVLGPLGNGFDVSREGKVLLAGGGIGVPPMLYTAKQLKECDTVLGFRTAAMVMLEDEFKKHCGEVVVSTDDGSYGFNGYAVMAAEELMKKNKYTAVYVCGPKIMLKTFAELAERYDVDCMISMEERMGCGFGTCLVCSCKVKAKTEDGFTYKRVCADGPVFDAKEVIFDD